MATTNHTSSHLWKSSTNFWQEIVFIPSMTLAHKYTSPHLWLRSPIGGNKWFFSYLRQSSANLRQQIDFRSIFFNQAQTDGHKLYFPPGLGGSFWPSLIRNKSHPRVLVALDRSSPYQISPGLGGSCWTILIQNEALSGPLSFVTNRTPGSWWLFLTTLIHHKAVSCPFFSVTNKVAPPGLGVFFWPTLIRNYCTPGSWWLFLAHSYPYQIAPPGLGCSGPLFSVTNIPRSWRLLLDHSYPERGSFWSTLIRNKSYPRVLVALSGPLLFVTNRTPDLEVSF